jgi:hypothetical protein
MVTFPLVRSLFSSTSALVKLAHIRTARSSPFQELLDESSHCYLRRKPDGDGDIRLLRDGDVSDLAQPPLFRIKSDAGPFLDVGQCMIHAGG